MKSTSALPAGYRRFNLDLEQPVDHTNPAGAKLKQRLLLLHKSETVPLILSTSGYGLSAGQSELTTLFGVNQLSFEHRYFAPSIPAAPVDWNQLTIEQSAADSHHIWESFKWLYPAKWANTGGSKGGETAVFHRRFHPCDVDATVAYVAPLVLGLSDKRFESFFENVGGVAFAACRAKLIDLSRAMLTRRDEIVPKLDAQRFKKLGRDMAYEYAVLDLIWSFWQYQPTSECNSLPSATATADVLLDFLNRLNLIEFQSDSSIEGFVAYYWQAGLELGLGSTYEAPFKSLLKFPSVTVDLYLPNLHPVFRPDAMPDVQRWVKTKGQRLMFIYGELDPYTAGAYELGAAVDSLKFIAPGNNHGSRIADLTAVDRENALSTLERWLNVKRSPAPVVALAGPIERRILRR